MLRSILTALDSSMDNDAVVELGVRWAKQFNAKLVGISVVDQPTMLDTTPALKTGGETTEMEGHWKEDEQRVEQCLQRFIDQCDEAGVKATTIKDVGPPANRILLEASRHDLVLLSPEFCTSASAGNTFSQVLRAAPRPIVGVSKDPPPGDAIVIAYDGSMQSSRTLQAFSTTGLDQSRQVYVVSVDEDLQSAIRQCSLAVEFLRLHDIHAELRPLESIGSVAEQLLTEIVTLEAGLLVLGAHKKPALKEMFLGSVTTTVLKEATVPLFLYH